MYIICFVHNARWSRRRDSCCSAGRRGPSRSGGSPRCCCLRSSATRTNSSRWSSCWPTRRYCCCAGPQQAGITSPCDLNYGYPRTNGPLTRRPKSSRDRTMLSIPDSSASASRRPSRHPLPPAMCSNDGRPSRNRRWPNSLCPTAGRKAR